MFVTQAPFGADFATVNSTFGNHNGHTGATPRGGDLYIRYGNGTLRNLTAEAGYGLAPGQDIAVREPSVHWDGNKALFSMVVGGTIQNDLTPVYWQIYEVTGFMQGQTVQITKLPQPTNTNNVSPFYGTDDRILFTSDIPRNGDRTTYPQLDEYESTATNTGIWSMNPDGTGLRLLDHSVSGAFTPVVASDGRVIFTRWDHLQRDQQSDEGTLGYGAFNYASESSATNTGSFLETYPELRTVPQGSYQHGHTINQFFPWQVNEDGSGLETVNHVGRHELLSYFDSSNDDLPYFFPPEGRRTATNLFQLKEDPNQPGYFYGTRAPEFGTHAAGQVIGLNAPISLNPDLMQVDYITDPNTAFPLDSGDPVPPGYAGHFRNPTPLSDGSLIAVQTTYAFSDSRPGGVLSANYNFRLVTLQSGGTYRTPGARLIPSGITKAISYFDNYSYQQLTYSGQMWELDPVEVRARPRPAPHTTPLPAIEQQILMEELGSQDAIDRLRSYLASHRLALLVSRNVTRRADRQQPFNLRIAGGGVQTSLPGSIPEDVEFMQFFQGDLVRGYSNFHAGRRPIAQVMHGVPNPPVAANAPPGSVKLGLDGSMAALVPSSRALSWQMTASNGAPVIRERYWVTFAPGEIRSCTNCHGINSTDTVLNQPSPTNPPQAFRDLVQWYKNVTGNGLIGDTIGVYTPANSAFFIRNSNSGGNADSAFFYGAANPNWIPLSGDWNGDGVDSPGLYNAANGTFFLKNTSGPGNADIAFTFGSGGAGIIPLVGDWDGDGTDTIGLYSSSNGAFFLRNFNQGGAADLVFFFGSPGLTPIAGDWNGDGRTTIGVYVQASGVWFLRNSNSSGPADTTLFYGPGGASWKPIVGDWNADGIDTVGLYVNTNGAFFLKNTNTSGAADLTFFYGPSTNAVPLVGDWNGG